MVNFYRITLNNFFVQKFYIIYGSNFMISEKKVFSHFFIFNIENIKFFLN